MEMQQPEFFIPRNPIHASRHLRLVPPSLGQPGKSLGQPGKSLGQPGRSLGQPATGTAGRSLHRRAQGGLRTITPEDIERVLNHLHGEALLVGALSYGLGLRLSQLRLLRIRDVNLAAQVIELPEASRQIPTALLEDLREHINDKVCGRAAGLQKRNQPLFSDGAFEEVLAQCSAFFASTRRREGASIDVMLRVMGWFHTKRIAKRGGRVQSPLGLFDKGPKIVRRDRGGKVHAYYLWRAVYSR